MQTVRDYINSFVVRAQSNPRVAALSIAGAAFGFAALAGLSARLTSKWEVADKVVIITGASSGIGKALALHLVRLGARVFLAARRQNELDATVNECNAIKEGSAGGLATDVSIRGDNKALVEATVARFGRIDAIILNAGISAGAPFEQVNEEGLNSFENVTKTNYFGPVYAAHYALPQLIQHQGRVVVISSVFGLTGGPTRTFYAGSKFALHGFFESLRMELAQHSVKVSLVCPGPVATDIALSRVGPDGQRATVGHFDMKKAITPERAAEYTVDALQRGERLRTFSMQSSLLLMLKNLAPTFCDWLVVRSMRKLGMLEVERKE